MSYSPAPCRVWLHPNTEECGTLPQITGAYPLKRRSALSSRNLASCAAEILRFFRKLLQATSALSVTAMARPSAQAIYLTPIGISSSNPHYRPDSRTPIPTLTFVELRQLMCRKFLHSAFPYLGDSFSSYAAGKVNLWTSQVVLIYMFLRCNSIADVQLSLVCSH